MREQGGDAGEGREDVVDRAVLRRPAPRRGRVRVGRHLDDVAVPGDGMHQGDRVPLEQPRQLAPEGPEGAGVDLDDAAAGDHVRDEAVDGLLGRAAADGVARLQRPVQRPLVQLADGRRGGRTRLAPVGQDGRVQGHGDRYSLVSAVPSPAFTWSPKETVSPRPRAAAAPGPQPGHVAGMRPVADDGARHASCPRTLDPGGHYGRPAWLCSPHAGRPCVNCDPLLVPAPALHALAW